MPRNLPFLLALLLPAAAAGADAPESPFTLEARLAALGGAGSGLDPDGVQLQGQQQEVGRDTLGEPPAQRELGEHQHGEQQREPEPVFPLHGRASPGANTGVTSAFAGT